MSDTNFTLFSILEPEGGELRIMNTLSVSGTQMNGRSTEQFGLFSATLVLTRR